MYYLCFILLSLCVLNLLQISDANCTGTDCQKVSMPLMGRSKAALIADLDITELKKALKTYIDQEVNKSVSAAVKSAVGGIITNVPDKENSTTPTEGRLDIKDCSDLKDKSKSDGVYHIYPTGKSGYKVYCDMTTDGGGWTVFQRRYNGQLVFFNKTWRDYANGFGKVNEEYWLGNDKLHELTANGTYVLRINLMDWKNITTYAVYDNFKVDDDAAGYKLHLGSYHGTAGDSMKNSNNMRFTTIDKNNDGRSTSCADVTNYRGAWWYPRNCGYSNLNGEYAHLSGGRGAHWHGFKGFYYSLKQTKMMIRRK